MIQELLYTSAPKGLKPGSRGFCTVLSTQGMSAPLAAALEGLSGYRPLFASTDPQHASNPVVHSHVTFSVGGRRVNVLSRISDFGLDYTQRTNKLAHHVVVDPENQPPAGPAWLLGRSDMIRSDWDGEPRMVPLRQAGPMGDVAPSACTHWKKVTGDAGWAGVLAEAFLKDPQRMAFLICPVGLDPLPLIAEAIALLPKPRRWDVTFSTYFTSAPQNVNCAWRCLYDGTPEVQQSRRYVQALRINLLEPMPPATGGALVELARTGRAPVTAPVSRPGSRDAAEAALEDLPPAPGSGGSARDGYRLQPVRKVAQPPLLETSPRRARPRGRRSMLGWVIGAVFLLAAAGVGVVAWQRMEGTGEAEIAQTDVKASESKQAAVSNSPPKSTPPKRATNPESPASQPPPTDPIPNQPPSEAEREKEPTESDSPPPSSNTDVASTEPPAIPPDSSQPPTEVAPPLTSRDGKDSSTEQSKQSDDALQVPSLAYVDVPEPNVTSETSWNRLDVALPDVDFDRIHLDLLIPVGYIDRLSVKATTVPHSLALSFIDRSKGPTVEPDHIQIATLRLDAGLNVETSAGIYLEWDGPGSYRDALRWCVLSIAPASDAQPRLWVLHKPIDFPGQTHSDHKLSLQLPRLQLLPLPNCGPAFLCEPINVQVGRHVLTFGPSGGSASKVPLSPLTGNHEFVSTTTDAIAAQFKDFDQTCFPRLRLNVASPPNEPGGTLRIGPLESDKLLKDFKDKWYPRVIKYWKDDQRLDVGSKPKLDEWFTHDALIEDYQKKWDDRIARARAATKRSGEEEAALAIDEAMQNLLRDCIAMKSLRDAIEASTIQSMRIYYEVRAGVDGTVVPVDVVRVVPGDRSE